MDSIIMPELITSKFAEVIAENPEVLKMIVDHQPGEKVIVGQNCTLDCNSNPTNVKLVFCNVTIGIDDTADECDKSCGAKERENQIGGCHIKISSRNQNQECNHWGALSSEQSQLALAVAVLEARKGEIEKILRLIPRQIVNRKLVARCKRDVLEVEEQLAAKKKELEYTTWLMEYSE
ncbi:MAG: hypothetical protein PHP79_04185 [Clostridia bacterium]|nr:hypothetical protein [Clostridia bacterium]